MGVGKLLSKQDSMNKIRQKMHGIQRTRQLKYTV